MKPPKAAFSKFRSFLAIAALVVLAGLVATQNNTVSADSSVTILPPGHTWEHTFVDPTGDSAWNTSSGGWGLAPAPFGNYTGGTGDSDFNWATWWTADANDGNDLWVRTTIDLTDIDLSSVSWGLGVDNGFKLYANGVEVGTGNAGGWTHRWEYSGGFSSELIPGLNYIAVALEDHGGRTGFDMQITGTFLDEDDDGVGNSVDNCLSTANADQADSDGDEVGNACDAFPDDADETTDSYGDGVGDNGDACPTVAGSLGNGCQSKGDILIASGVDTKGTQNAPGLREGFNPKGKGEANAGKKNK